MTAPASPATGRPRSRWTRPVRRARSTSPDAGCAPSRCRYRPARSATSTTSSLEEFCRALALNAKLTLHLTVERGTNAHHVIEAAFKAAGAGAAVRGRARRGRARRAQHQGDARMTRVAVIDYGMGNRRSVEKALEHVGARATITSDHDELRRADGLVLPGVGAFPLAMRNLRRARASPSLIRERGRPGQAAARHLPRHAAAVRHLRGARAARPGSG